MAEFPNTNGGSILGRWNLWEIGTLRFAIYLFLLDTFGHGLPKTNLSIGEKTVYGNHTGFLIQMGPCLLCR